MDDEHEILMKFSNVDIELSDDSTYNGYFMLLYKMTEIQSEDSFSDLKYPTLDGHIEAEDLSNYYFEWIPNLEANSSKESDDSIPNPISISAENVSEILKREISFTQVALRFVLLDSSRLPRIIFNQFGQLHVQHFLDYLVYKKILIARESTPNAFRIIHQSSKTDANIFEYTPTSSIPNYATNVAEHNEILKKLKNYEYNGDPNPVSLTEFNDLVNNGNFDIFKKEVFERGLDNEARPYGWACLLGIVPFTPDKNAIIQHFNTKMTEYKRIRDTISLYTPFQFSHSQNLQDIRRVIYFDVLRTDRHRIQFKGKENPNLGLLETDLTVYSLYNRDSGYCQGMSDLLSPFVVLFIKEWTAGDSNYETSSAESDFKDRDEEVPNMAGKDYSKGRKAVFYDGVVRTYEEAEAFIFWSFVGMMELTEHERLFSNLATGQRFVLERAATIATSVHLPLQQLLKKYDLVSMDFLLRPILLLFKRNFKSDDLYRLWDLLFAAEHPHCYPRFIAAACLIMVYPKLLLHTDGTLGEVMSVLEGALEKTEIEPVLNITKNLIKEVALPFEKHNYIYESLHEIEKFRNYKSKYLKFPD